jgi:hypothetical protein
MINFEDQAKAAIRETRELLNATMAGVPQKLGDGKLFNELWPRFETARLCRHLIKIPIQPMFLMPFDGIWRCKPCLGGPEVQSQRGTLSPVEEQTCDICHQVERKDPIGMLVVRYDIWTLMLGACTPCFEKHSEGSVA